MNTAIRGLIERRALEGDTLEAIDQDLIESDQALNEEQRAALWLYARHHTQTARRSHGAGTAVGMGRGGAEGGRELER